LTPSVSVYKVTPNLTFHLNINKRLQLIINNCYGVICVLHHSKLSSIIVFSILLLSRQSLSQQLIVSFLNSIINSVVFFFESNNIRFSFFFFNKIDLFFIRFYNHLFCLVGSWCLIINLAYPICSW